MNKSKNRNKNLGSDKGLKGKFRQMQQLKQMQDEMKKTRAALAKEVVTVVSSGGQIEIEVTGDQRIQNIKIASELIDDINSDKLGQMLVESVNEAIERSQALAASKLEELTSGLGLGFPGL